MTFATPIRRTNVQVAIVWLLKAMGAFDGLMLITSTINATGYVTTVFPNCLTASIGKLAQMSWQRNS